MCISIKMAMPFRKEDIEAACVSAALCLGYDNLKDEQKSVITKFVSGSDVFAILPTGFGKSLCYACLPGVFDRLSGMVNSIVVVLTPLTATMKDQVLSPCLVMHVIQLVQIIIVYKHAVDVHYTIYIQVASFSAKGLLSAYITADQEDITIIQGVTEGNYKLVFFTPEMLLLKKKWRYLLTTPQYSENLKAIVVDEAHTVKKWYVHLVPCFI